MRRIELSQAGPVFSRLGFGCAPVMGRVGRRQSLDSMGYALDCGVTHFDVARSYGFGDAERVVGSFVKGRRDQVTITSKFGVIPPVLKAWQKVARPIVRPLRAVLTSAHGRIRSVSHSLLDGRRFDVTYARSCLEESLRQLRTDYLDVYLLHEPSIDQLHGCEEVREFLDDAVVVGKVRAWGVAHASSVSMQFAKDGWGEITQHEPCGEAGKVGRDPDERLFRFITRPLAGGNLELAYARGPMDVPAGLSDVEGAFFAALAEAGTRGAVVAGMFTRHHILHNVRAIEVAERLLGERRSRRG